MHKPHYVYLLGTIVLISNVSFAQAKTCAQKQQDIENQLRYAKQHNNVHQENGLKQALSQLKANCKDSQLRSDAAEKVKEKELKVQKAQQELQEAQTTGNIQKVADKKGKLRKAQCELSEAKAEI